MDCFRHCTHEEQVNIRWEPDSIDVRDEKTIWIWIDPTHYIELERRDLIYMLSDMEENVEIEAARKVLENVCIAPEHQKYPVHEVGDHEDGDHCERSKSE